MNSAKKKEMIKAKLGIFLIIVIGFSLLNCAKEEAGYDDIKTSDTLTTGLAARLDNANWVPGIYEVTIANGFTYLAATVDTGGQLVFSVAGTTPGVYNFGGNSLNVAYFKPNNAESLVYTSMGNFAEVNLSQVGGMVVISSVSADSGIISGSFIFNLYNATLNKSITITQGTFNNVPFITVGEANLGSWIKTDQEIWVTDVAKASTFNGNLYLSLKSRSRAGFTDYLEMKLQSAQKGLYNLLPTGPNTAEFYSGQGKAVYSLQGSNISCGKINIDYTSGGLISGQFTLLLADPANKKTKIIHSGAFKRLKVEMDTLPEVVDFSAAIEGQHWGAYYSIMRPALNGYTELVASEGNGKPKFRLFFADDVDSTTNFEGIGKPNYAFYYNEAGNLLVSKSGNINYSLNDNTLKFGFDFEAEALGKRVSVTNGSFLIP